MGMTGNDWGESPQDWQTTAAEQTSSVFQSFPRG
jgi:hypothetical protein